MTSNVFSIVSDKGQAGASAALLVRYDDALEHMADELDQVIKYAGIERKQILEFMRRKFFSREQPFSALPPLSWQENNSWAIEPLRIHILRAIGRVERVSDRDRYVLLASLYGRVRDRMRPAKVLLQSIDAL